MSCLDETAAVRADALENGATTVACISWPGWLSLFRRESQVARLISRVSVPTPCRLVKILSMAGAPHYSGLRRRRGWRLLVQIARLQTLLLSASDKIVWSACSPRPDCSDGCKRSLVPTTDQRARRAGSTGTERIGYRQW